ncbi:La-related protein 1 [Portunus trituberculatus]|uniref:La-related protein 1 n=1 Tax=Portunus trituberculatus TaxID=210409 RepID=A0A5B7DBA4_PORTR|nr:La-related protein 1 [Portunus trituberculatus]
MPFKSPPSAAGGAANSTGSANTTGPAASTSVTTRPPKHGGYDRTGDWTSRTKITQELAKVINDGLYYYEQDLWEGNEWGANEAYEEIVPPTPKTPRSRKAARFFPVVKDKANVDQRTPRKKKTRHSHNPPVESHVGWVMDSREHKPRTNSVSSGCATHSGSLRSDPTLIVEEMFLLFDCISYRRIL